MVRCRNDTLEYRAVNACILFLPILDGAQLITVEHLRAPDGTLHPAQRALVECHGSQCGFCTPGFVMSLFALFHSDAQPSRKHIEDVLAGNLCRCTGYAPIVEAAGRMYAHGRRDHFTAREPATRSVLESLRRDKTLELSHRGRRYFAPTTLSELATLRQQHPNAHLLAGGTDIGLWVTKEHRDLDTVIYVGDVPALQQCEVIDDHIEIGAAVTYSDALDVIGRYFSDFAEVIRRLGSVQIRNAATMIGNVATASPIGDSMPALIALGTTAVLRRGHETREVPLDQFFVGYRKTLLYADEFIVRLRIPTLPANRVFKTYKLSKRFDQDISAVCGAFVLELADGQVRGIRICYGGMAAVPKRAAVCEGVLQGSAWTRESVDAGTQALDEDFAPITDLRGSDVYRRLVAKNLLIKFFIETTTPAIATRVLAYVE